MGSTSAHMSPYIHHMYIYMPIYMYICIYIHPQVRAWHVVDLCSGNGTAVNGIELPARGKQMLVHGDVIRFGRPRSTVQYRFVAPS